MNNAEPLMDLRGGGYSLDMANLSNGTFYKVDVIAALFNLSVRRIQQLTQEGILPTVDTTEGRRYELVPTVQRYVKYLSDKAYGGKNRASEKESELKQQKLEAEIALKNLQGDYRQIQNDIAIGKYIAVDKVKDDYRSFFNIFKKFALGIPPKVSARLGGLYNNPNQIRAIEKSLHSDVLVMLNSFIIAGIKPGELITEQDKKGKTESGSTKKNAKSKDKKI